MDLKSFLEKLDAADRRLDRTIELIFILFGAGFGAWLIWTMLGAANIGLWARLGASFGAAIIAGALMWVFWFFARILG